MNLQNYNFNNNNNFIQENNSQTTQTHSVRPVYPENLHYANYGSKLTSRGGSKDTMDNNTSQDISNPSFNE